MPSRKPATKRVRRDIRRHTGNIYAAYELGLNAAAFPYALHYKSFFRRPLPPSQDAPAITLDRLARSLDTLRPMVAECDDNDISALLRSARNVFEQDTSMQFKEAIAKSVCDRLRGVLDEHWTLLPWFRLGRAFGDCLGEVCDLAKAPEYPLKSPAHFLQALNDLPEAACKRSPFLDDLRLSLARIDAGNDLFEIRLRFEDRDTLGRLAAIYYTTKTIHFDEYSVTFRDPEPSKDSLNVQLRRLKAKVRQATENVDQRHHATIQTIDVLERLLFKAVKKLPDAPVLAFENCHPLAVVYKGRHLPVTDNYRKWLRLLYAAEGKFLSENQLISEGRVSKNKLAQERKNGPGELDRILETVIGSNGGAKMMCLEP